MARELTNDQQTAIAAALPDTGTLEIFLDTSIAAAEEFSGKIAGMFAERGWNVIVTPLSQPWGATPSGLAIMAPSDMPLSDIQKTVRDAFTASELPFNHMDAMLPEGVDVKLLVGRVGV